MVNSPCDYQVLFESKSGCPVLNYGKYIDTIADFLKSHTPIFAIVLMLLGVVIGIYGKTMWDIVIFVLFAITFTGLFMVFIAENLIGNFLL